LLDISTSRYYIKTEVKGCFLVVLINTLTHTNYSAISNARENINDEILNRAKEKRTTYK